MFEELIEAPLALRMHRTMPMVEERIRYLTHLKSQGYAHNSLTVRAPILLSVVDAVDFSVESISSTEIVNQVEGWLEKNRFRNKALRARMVTTLAKQFAQFLGKLKDDAPWSKLISPSHLVPLREYLDFLENEKHSSPKTIIHHRGVVSSFLRWATGNNIPLKTLTIENLDEYIKSKGISRRSMATIVSVVKSFLIYCERNEICQKKISHALHGPRIYRYENLPRGPSWASVQKLLAKPDLKTKEGIRDRAILLLLSVYGLRSAEVVALKLDDIDWEEQTMTVNRAKNLYRQVFPLTKEIGEAIILYLKEARPKKNYREIFLTVRAPITPMAPSNLGGLTKKYYKQAKIEAPSSGPHSLRHACASNLLNKNLSLKEIGDHLGHLGTKSVTTYAKVDINGLREVGDFDLGELA